MENSHLQLLAELPGLESAQRAIAARIDEIRQALGLPAGDLLRAKAGAVEGLPLGDVLGRDSLGRMIRKRNLSPEVKENRRRLIAAARHKKLEKLKEVRCRNAVVTISSK